MMLYEAVKNTVTTLQAAERYGLKVGRGGMCKCPFHNDRNPSMKVDKRFHCFGCQADGDVIDFTSRFFSLSPREAAIKLADDFGIQYDEHQPVRPVRRSHEISPGDVMAHRISITTLSSVRQHWTALINSEMCGTPAGLLQRSATSSAVNIIFQSCRIRKTKPFPMRNGRAINPN